ncbi:hypothetical protein C0W96_18135 [Photobacterium kishitanii]|uniref:hypothetical protein n=1 Tax=Photobacterium kishitanii TaxID=318456 RepID=UPI000D16B9FE|nr:hypothetical protein [Photobacterium kishitanii]PSV03991.1 hypothetical protein C0W96_18135 [Photobacterium kishitanii]PSV13078.1 hypothetical protein C0W59_17300 [Photobacterium kishitanii]PSV72091.1 hypothetical protein C0W29_20345 [Photobacterium kishitanii]
MKQISHKTNLVFFYSEGAPNDNALDLSENKKLVIDAAKDHVDNIIYYTPKKLRDSGWHDFLKEYKSTGLVTANPGMSKIGFSAWKPLIILLELEKMDDGDIVIYRDSNMKKYAQLADYSGIKSIAEECLAICGFDFFTPHHDFPIKNKNITKTNVLRELGEDHTFSYEYPTIMGNFIVVRKSEASVTLLKEWIAACKHNEWINGEQYGELDPNFSHSTSEQAILSVIIANWIRKGKYNIPMVYPLISFQGRNIKKIKFNTDFSYLSSLNKSDAEYLELPKYAGKESLRGIFELSLATSKIFYYKKNYQLIKLIKKINKNNNKINSRMTYLREKLGKQ